MRKLYSLGIPRFAIWPTLPLSVHFQRASVKLPFPLDQGNCVIYSLARHAIFNALQAFKIGVRNTILVPAYHHGSEVEALVQAGLQIKYYEVNELLEPDPKDLEDLLEPGVGAFYLIHYLGFPQDAGFWRQWCDDRQLILIEDAAQAFLATRDERPVGSFGHMAVFCLYKTFGIPDGGAVVSVLPPTPPAALPKSGVWRMFKRHVNWVAAKRGELGFLHLLIKPALAWLKRVSERPHAEFDMGNPNTPPSAVTMRLLPKIVDEGTARQRRENYRFLLEHLSDMVPEAFSCLPEGASPFAFPVEVSNAKLFLERLRGKGVVGLLFWLNPHPSLPVEKYPRSRALRERVLALPVHQELTKSDLIRIVNAVQECRIDERTRVTSTGEPVG